MIKMEIEKYPISGSDGKILHRGQGEFINIFNRLGIIMASMPEYYEAGKTANSETLARIQRNLNESVIISGTRNHYNDEFIEDIVTHYFGSKVTKPKILRLKIPCYDNIKINNVTKEYDGLFYLQFLFDTIDPPDKIKSTLGRLGDKTIENILIKTPCHQHNKIRGPTRAVILFCRGDKFYINGSGNIDDSGLAYEVF